MTELKDLNIEELLNEALEHTNYNFSLYDVKQVIMSRFAEKNKVIELMAKEIQEYTSYAPIKVIIQDFAGRVKRQIQADKEKP